MQYLNNRLVKDWMIFIAVVEGRSFTHASKKLFCSVASVSKSISRLEDVLKVVLLTRNAHKVEITAAGYVAYNRAKEICQVYQELFSEISNHDNKIKGKLRFSAPSVLCEYAASQWVYHYMQENRDVELKLLSRDRTELTVISPEFDDLVLKSGVMDSSGLVHQSLGTVSFQICASPDYLAQHEKISTPDDLAHHWIMKVDHPFLSYPLSLTCDDGSINLSLKNDASLVSNNIPSLLKMTLSGAGVCVALPEFIATCYVKRNELMVVLPEWTLPQMPIYLVWRWREHYSRLFFDFRKYIEKKWSDLQENGIP